MVVPLSSLGQPNEASRSGLKILDIRIHEMTVQNIPKSHRRKACCAFILNALND